MHKEKRKEIKQKYEKAKADKNSRKRLAEVSVEQMFEYFKK